MSNLRKLILLRFARMTQHELGAVEAHGKRKGDVEHVDPSRTHLNEFLVGDENLTALAEERIVELQKKNAERKRASLKKGRRKSQLSALDAAIDEAGDDPKALADVIGWPWDHKNVHPFTEGMLSISQDWFLDDRGKISDARVEEFKAFASSYLAEEFGHEVIYARLDLDEKTPHVSFVVAPEHENRKSKRLELSHHSHRLFGRYEAEVPVFEGEKPDPRQAKRSYEFFQDRIAAHAEVCGLDLSRGERRASDERKKLQRGEVVVKRANVSPSRGRDLALILTAEADDELNNAQKARAAAECELVVTRSDRAEAGVARSKAVSDRATAADALRAVRAREKAITVGVDAVMTDQLVYVAASKTRPEGMTWGPEAPEGPERRSWLRRTIEPARDWLVRFAKRFLNLRQREDELERQEAEARRQAAVLAKAAERAGVPADKALATITDPQAVLWDENAFPGAWAIASNADQTELRARLDAQTNRNLRVTWLATCDAVRITAEANGPLHGEFVRGESVMAMAATERGVDLETGRYDPTTATDPERATLHTDQEDNPIRVVRRDRARVRLLEG